MNATLEDLYAVLGITRQGVHQYLIRQDAFNKKVSALIIEADELRLVHPGCGVEKMYDTLKPDFIGRDRFVELFMELGYRIRRIPNYHITTIPTHLKYPNLIEGLLVTSKNIVWQSDITYFKVGDTYYYIVFIIDIYTKQIVGYAVSNHLRADANMRALKMAISKHGYPQIHHSDRGSQYIANKYVNMLIGNNVKISMGLQAQDNAYAERINGTIKIEYLNHWNIESFNLLKKQSEKSCKPLQ